MGMAQNSTIRDAMDIPDASPCIIARILRLSNNTAADFEIPGFVVEWQPILNKVQI